MKEQITEYCCDICGKISTNVKEYRQLLLPCRITYNKGTETYESSNINQWAEFDICEKCRNFIHKNFRENVADIVKNMDTDTVFSYIKFDEEMMED